MNDFQKYLIKYCAKHQCNEAEAKCHEIVQEVEKYYNHVNDGKITTTTNMQFCCGGVIPGGEAK